MTRVIPILLLLAGAAYAQRRGSCRTVSGPNPNADCVFPFIYKGRQYNGCPVDPDDSSKRWCSTKVDSEGKHVGGQNQYGHCDRGCPSDDNGTPLNSINRGDGGGGGGRYYSRYSRYSSRVSRKVSDKPATAYVKMRLWLNFDEIYKKGSPSSSSGRRRCNGSEECRSVGECALRFSADELDRRECRLPTGGEGLCCSDLTTNALRSGILPETDAVLRSGPPIDNFSVRQAVIEGETFVENVTRSVGDDTTPVRKGTPQAAHTDFQRARKGVADLNERALVAMQASRSLRDQEPDVGVREADVSGTMLDRCYPEIFCDPEARFRNIDGTCNNLEKPILGKLNTPLSRILPNAYADGFNFPRVARSGLKLPSARFVSTTTAGTDSSPSGEITALLMSFGQFVDHDLTHVPIQNNGEEEGPGLNCCPNGRLPQFDELDLVECFPIPIPANDPVFKDECINFPRSMTAPRIDCFPGPSEQLNQITHWLDSSNVYGSDDEEAESLRTFREGLLATTPAGFGQMDLLPEDPENPECRSTEPCFVAGDSRVNEQPNLAVMHTLFVREHNRIAREMKKLNPRWDDERIYQESKRIVNAEWQHIVFNEFLPVLIGPRFMDVFGLWPLNTGFSRDYRGDFDPRITNEFAVAAFRVGHTLIPSLVRTLFRRRGASGRELLRDLFSNVDQLRAREGVDSLLRGLVGTPTENVDDNFSEEIINFLFDGDVSQLDLVALNLQRSRDHGVPGYVRYREICGVDGGKKARNFNDLSNNISREKIQRLRRAYQNVGDIDLFVGMFLEDPGFNGGLVGQTFLCLIGDQFARLKKGDRFFYDLEGEPGSFTLEQLDQIRKVTFSRLVCDNSDNIKEIQPLSFQLPIGRVNAVTSCDGDTIPTVDLSVFRERDSGRRG